MVNQDKITISCYSGKDEEFMSSSYGWRLKVFKPLMDFCIRCSITPMHITIASMVLGVAGSFAILISPPLAAVLITTHGLMDLLDGSLARYTGSSTRKGAFVDIVNDHLVLAVNTIVLMYLTRLSAPAGGIYLTGYYALIAFSMMRNSMGAPYQLLLRPRVPVYLWLLVEFFIFPGTLEWVVWLCNILLLAQCAIGFRAIMERLGK